jgi:hypothetical protein
MLKLISLEFLYLYKLVFFFFISMKKYLGLYIALSFILFFSCRKDEGPWWNAEFSGPIAKSSIGIQELFPDSNVITNPDSSLRLIYNETVFDLKIDSLFSIPDTTLDTAYVSPLGGYSFQPGDQIFSTPPNENFLNISGVQLKQLILKSGKIKLELISSITEPIVFKYDLLNSKLNGIPFSIVESVPGSGSIIKFYDISGLDLNLTGTSGNLFNTIISQNTMFISSSANAGFISFGQGIIIKISFINVVPFYGRGYLGNQNLSIGPETVSSGFLNGINADYFALADANIDLKISNGIGADIQANNVILKSKNTFSGNQITLSGSGVNSSYNINRATFQNLSPQPVVPSNKNFLMNTNNSNIKQFIENLPDQLEYSADIVVNPLGNVSGNNDFVLYGYGLKTEMKIDIPFAFSAVNLRFRDTADIDLSGEELKNINSANLYLNVNNGYPFSANIQGYLCDESLNIIDSLFINPNFINPATVDVNYIVNGSIKSVLPCVLTAERLTNLKKSKKIIFNVKINTLNSPQIIKIYKNYRMDISLTGDINYSVNKE